MQSIFNKGHASCLKDEKLRVFRNLSKYNKNHLNKIIPKLNVWPPFKNQTFVLPITPLVVPNVLPNLLKKITGLA